MPSKAFADSADRLSNENGFQVAVQNYPMSVNTELGNPGDTKVLFGANGTLAANVRIRRQSHIGGLLP